MTDRSRTSAAGHTAAEAEYLPLAIDAWRNAGSELLQPKERPPLGACVLRGIPFSIGGDLERCFIAFGPGLHSEPIALPVGRAVRRIVFAHRLLDSALLDGGPIGAHIADYTLRFRSGTDISRPIRERFEILRPRLQLNPSALALSERAPTRPARFVGNFGAAGRRLMDIEASGIGSYVLWAWSNPRPDDPVSELVIAPAGPRFIVAGVTLGFLDEHPLVPARARPVRVEVLDPATANRPFDLELDIDRGYATFPYPLSRLSPDDFLASPLPGFGTPLSGSPEPGDPIQRGPTSPAYAHVAAVPSARLAVHHGGIALGEVAWSDLEAGGAVEREGIRLTLVDSGRNWIRTSIVDDATGLPIPCRVHFRSPEGIPYQPHGHHSEVNAGLNSWHLDVGGDVRLGEVTYAYVDGSCEGWLPRGEVLVDAAHGFEYEPLRDRIEIAPGQRDLMLRLRRFADMGERRWFSGDTHVHFLSPHGALLEGRAEGLNVVNLLAAQWGHLFTNVEDFVGSPLHSSDGTTVVYTSQENRQHFLGHLTLLALKRPVFPLSSDGPLEAELGGGIETTLAHWADEARAQGATIVMPHAPRPNGELAALVATGRADAFEHIGAGDALAGASQTMHREYYRYLNCGYPLPLVGGTDKMSADVPVGLMRTYVRIADEAFSYEAWCRNLRAGRTFISSGPLLALSVDGAEIGDVVRLPPGGGTVEVHASVESVLPVERLELVVAGEVVATADAHPGTRRIELRERITIGANTWIAARAGGRDYHRPMPHCDEHRRGIKAHTSPIYVACGAAWSMFDPEIAQSMLTLTELSLEHLRELRLRDVEARVTHRHAEADHQAFLERSLHEAEAAIRKRLRHHATTSPGGSVA